MVSSLENAFCRYLSVFRRFSTTYSLQFTGKDPLVQDGLDTYFVQHTFKQVFLQFTVATISLSMKIIKEHKRWNQTLKKNIEGKMSMPS